MDNIKETGNKYIRTLFEECIVTEHTFLFIYLFKRDNAHQWTFSVYTQNVNMPELAKKLIFICSPLAGHHVITLH